MVRFLFITLVFLCVQINYAQIKSGHITYKVNPPESINDYVDTTTIKDKKALKYVVKQIEELNKSASFLNYELVFNETESFFYMPNILEKDSGVNLKEIAGMTGFEGVYYTNSEEDLSLQQLNAFSKNYIIERKTDTLSWKIKDQTDEIKGYTVRKATLNINVNGLVYDNITAWFSPDIPFSIGPLGLSGLPGAILALERNHHYFYADQIKLSKNKKEIKRPEKGKKTTEEGYFREMDKITDRLRGKY